VAGAAGAEGKIETGTLREAIMELAQARYLATTATVFSARRRLHDPAGNPRGLIMRMSASRLRLTAHLDY
jgi:hypothetical protein